LRKMWLASPHSHEKFAILANLGRVAIAYSNHNNKKLFLQIKNMQQRLLTNKWNNFFPKNHLFTNDWPNQQQFDF
jgi:hypothetical protein